MSQPYLVPAIAIGALSLVSLYPIHRYCQGGQLSSAAAKQDLIGKVYVVTGANVGIGYETMKQLYKQNATVYLLCRSEEKARAAMKSVQNSINDSKGELHFVHIDLMDLETVKKAAKELKSHLGSTKIEALVNNAGIMHHPHATTKQGFEVQFGTNHLAHYVLTMELLNQVDPSGRVVNLSSLAHEGGTKTINFDNLQSDAKSQSTLDLYNQSKLSNVLFTKALARRLENKGSKIRVMALHPGVVRTNLVRNWNKLFLLISSPLAHIILKSAKNGAQTTLHCTLDPNVKSGAYYSDCKEKDVVFTATDQDFQEKLWKLSIEWSGVDGDQVIREL